MNIKSFFSLNTMENRTKIAKVAIILCTMLIFSWTISILNPQFNTMGNIFNISNQKQEKLTSESYNNLKASGSTSNYEILNEIFVEKLSDYASLGYFPQPYYPSLQATYYALYILDAIGHLDDVNSTAILDFILSHYNDQTGMFEDIYSMRYLDSVFSIFYYPLTTVLEINCYAILSLNILGQLSVINTQHFIDFIWSCYNPEGPFNGFIGQPYNVNLEGEFKNATMDNTFFAVNTLNILLDDWSPYNYQKTRIIQFILNLQSNGNYPGFSNDLNDGFDSLEYSPEPGLLASYYCLKTLETFGMLDIIRVDDFHQFLETVYYNDKYYFDDYKIFNGLGMPNRTNMMNTVIGLELSDMTNFEAINREEVLSFLLRYRAPNGGWYTSSSYKNYELIDTYQIIRSLLGTGEISRLTETDKNSIANFLRLFMHYNDGYSLISREYMSVDLIHAVISAFDLCNRIPDLAIQQLYTDLSASYSYLFDWDFSSYCPIDDHYTCLHSYPIEYFCIGTTQYSKLYNMPVSLNEGFKVLDTLQKIFKLDDFDSDYDLNNFISYIINSQILDGNSEYHGAFVPFKHLLSISNSLFFETLIRFEHSYYAIKILELITNFLGLGTLTDLSFNKGALLSFISNHIAETDSFLYLNWSAYDMPENILENTYYMIYILKALDLYDLNNAKIQNYLVAHLDYGNSKILYYVYKIAELLELNIEFDPNLTNALVKNLYSEELNEFYKDMSYTFINPETFLWFSEIARNDDLRITCSYAPVSNLGSITTISTSFRNLILDDFGPYISVKFETDQLGTLNFEEQASNFFELNFIVPIRPDVFPEISGHLKVYDGLRVIGQMPLTLQTTFDQIINHSISQTKNHISFKVNISRRFSYEGHSLPNSTILLKIFQNTQYLETKTLNHVDFPLHSYFTLDYPIMQGQDYDFTLTLFDEYYPTGLLLLDQKVEANEDTPFGNIKGFTLTGPVLAFSALGFGLLLTCLTVVVAHLIKARKFRTPGSTHRKTKKLKKISPAKFDPPKDKLGERMKKLFFKSIN